MSELIQKNDNCATIRWKLLSSVSALALTIAVSSVTVAKAEDADRQTIWIELGGQAEDITGQGQPFAPAFLAKNPDASILWSGTSPIQAQKPPLFNFGEEGKITFQPESSDWVFSAALRYGRSGTSNEVDHQTNRVFRIKYDSGVPNYNSNPRGIDKFSDTHVHQSETHSILDFSAGKDVGLGLFGKDSTSTVSLGVRFAQFESRSTFDIRARPEVEFKYVNAGQNYPSVFGPGVSFQFPYYHTYHATMRATRSFHGVGPSLSWSGNAPFAGNPQDGEITLDWGVNAALLFGKQKADVKHQEYQRYVSWQFAANGGANYHSPYPIVYGGHSKTRSVTVPNVGGSLGLSYRYQDAKISLGYRTDFFFGAMDAGIDAVKKSNVTFNGPYASISIGLGD